ncbi:helix-turn-helix domain-containing protein [Paenibacillus antri]|uniref:Helix-turn-helix domain-containing protein n=1 Tax=Paenibacillus antri TaxID=2582848 RepID=A0A5R9G7V7_9BACL|nr:AraC family transcriptional regulator [Paenibacillus antri]TLS49518.1 helix-turn-helix domain-containing protein [Paenibacillus antri]
MAEHQFRTDDGAIQVDYTRRIGYYSMDEDHAHDGYELYYLFEGERDYFIRDRTYRVRAGEFVFIEKGELHRTLDTGVPDHERVVLNFAETAMGTFPLPTESGVFRLPPQERWKGEALAREMIDESRGAAPGRDAMLEALLRQLLLLVFRAAAERPVDEAAPSAVHRTMSEVAAYVGERYAEPLLLKDVAERFFVSPYYLSRKFKACTGFGFAEYVQLVRVREAQRLLRETNLKMIDIAERIGIGPAAQFHKLFKKVCGCSPLQYRKGRRAGGPAGSAGEANR